MIWSEVSGTATLVEMKPETFWHQMKIKAINLAFPEALKPVELLCSTVKGAHGKKRRKWILLPRLLRFTLCFFLFVAQLPLCLLRCRPIFPDPRPLLETDSSA